MNQKKNNTMNEMRNYYEQKYKQLFVLESGKVVKANKNDVYIDENATAHLKQNAVENEESMEA